MRTCHVHPSFPGAFCNLALPVGLHTGLDARLHVKIIVATMFRECAPRSSQKCFFILPMWVFIAGQKATWGRRGSSGRSLREVRIEAHPETNRLHKTGVVSTLVKTCPVLLRSPRTCTCAGPL